MIALLRGWFLGACRWAYTSWHTRDVLVHGREDIKHQDVTASLGLETEGNCDHDECHRAVLKRHGYDVLRNDGTPLRMLKCPFCHVHLSTLLCACGARGREIGGSSLLLWERGQ